MKTLQKYSFIFLIISFAFLSGCRSKQPVPAERTPAKEVAPVSELRQLESTALLIDGTRQKILGNMSNALVLYSEALRADPANSAAMYELARIHAQQGHLRDAETFARRAASLEPRNVFYHLVLADILFLQGKNQEGVDVQKNLASQNPNNLNLQISLLTSLIYTQKYTEAIALIDHIESIAGFNDELSLQKQKLFLELNQPQKAIEEAQRLVSFFPQEPVYLELLAELYQETGRGDKALEIYHRMLEIQPDNAMARLLLADHYRQKGDEEESFRQLKLAFQSPQFGVEGKARILFTFYHLSEQSPKYLARAYELLHLLIEAHPDDAEANALFGDFLYRDEKLEEARAFFYKAALLDPADIRFWQQVLIIDSSLSDYDNMLEASEQALEYFFEQPVIFLFNGLAHMQKKNYTRAIESFRTGKDLTPDDIGFRSQFLTLLGDAYYKAGKWDDSDRSYREALTLDPHNVFALNNFAYHLALRGKDLDKALEMSARALKAEPENAAFLDTYGWIHYKMGDFVEAEKWIRRSLDVAEEPSATVLEQYGDVLYRLGRAADALIYWEKALQVKNEKEDEEVSDQLQRKISDKTLYE